MKLLAFLLSAAVALEVCFDDQSCFDMNTVSLPPQELVDIVLAPNSTFFRKKNYSIIKNH